MAPLRILHRMRTASHGFAEVQRQDQDPDRAHQGERDGESKSGRLVKRRMDAEATKRPVHKAGSIDGTAREHGHHEPGRLPPGELLQDAVPFPGAVAFRQRVIDNRLVGAACEPFGKSTQDPVCQAEEKKHRSAVEWGEEENRHLCHHAASGGHEKGLSTDPIGKHSGGNIGEEAGGRPSDVEHGVLGGRQAQIEKQDCDDRVIETAGEEHPEPQEESPVPVRIGGL